MNNQKYKRYLITAALPYANGGLHIGHLAGCYLPADVYVRFLRAQKKDVLFIGGSDEHGVPITIRARKEKSTPQQVVDKYHSLIARSLKEMNISFDIYDRTSSEHHHKYAQAFFKTLYEKNILEEKESEQFYDPEEQVFLADRYITGECPHCSYASAYGDQCEHCGATLSPEELKHPRSALSAAAPIKKKTRHWYFPLQKYAPDIQARLDQQTHWKSNVRGQCRSWLAEGLQARAITRDSAWGVPVPLENAEGKVLYVWFDAPIGYISATQQLTPRWQEYWCREDTALVHFIGKDNIVFHCIMFPAMLQAHGGFILPYNVPANEFLNIEGEKISTSRNWAVWVEEYIQDFPNAQDLLRYVLLSIAPENKDSDFTWQDFQNRVNHELVAILGNFIHRSFILTHKLCRGKIPPFFNEAADTSDKEFFSCFQQTKDSITEHLNAFKFREALFEVIDLARKGNRYLQQKEPWIWQKKLTENPIEIQKKIDNTLYNCLQCVAHLAIFLHPFLPQSSEKICKMLKVVPRILEWEHAGKKLLNTGYPIAQPELLFQPVEDAAIKKQKEKLMNSKENKTDTTPAPTPENTAPAPINIEQFFQTALKIGTITHASAVPKTDKLLQLSVRVGTENKTILSGIAQHFSPDELIGKQVVVVANLEPRKMRGIESQGMLLLCTDEAGKLVFVAPERPVPSGSEVR